MSFNKIFFAILFIFFALQICFAQEKTAIDSLKTLILKDSPDTNKIIHLNKLALEYLYLNSDLSVTISNESIKLATKLFTESDNNNVKITSSINILKSCYQLASYYDYNNNINLAIYFNLKSIFLSNYLQNIPEQNKNVLKSKSIALSNIGNIYNQQSNFPKALNYYFDALKIAEEINNKKLITTNLGNIGIIYKYQGNLNKALEYYFKALENAKKINNKTKISSILGNIAIVFDNQNNNKKALEYYFKALNIAKEINDKACIETNLINIGSLYQEEKQYEKALENYSIALKIANEIGDNNNIIVLQGNIGSLYSSTKKYDYAKKYLDFALTGADSTNYLLAIQEFSDKLSELYEKTGKPALALKYYKKAMQAKDSLFSEDKNQEITRKEMNFEFEKKQSAIKAEQDKKDAVANAKKNRQQIILTLVMCLLLLFIIFTLLVYKTLKTTRKQKQIIEEQKFIVDEKNCELNSQNEEISAQRDEIEAQRESLYLQKNELEKIHNGLKSSIRYAKQIQTALLPSHETLSNIFNEYFVLFKPCDIVSGDFYWATKRNDWILFAVADCTGHGVPGGFMSMLGISFLNEIIPNDNINNASKTLDELRKYIIRSLKQKGINDENITTSLNMKDGMDIAFCALNTKTLELHYAGANNPLYIVRKSIKLESEKLKVKSENDQNFELYELKGDKMPVAIHIRMDNFTNQIFQLEYGDTLYLSSDGFADQFGGNDSKKFKYSKLKELLLKINQLPMEKQLLELETAFNKWKGNLNQIDDVTILGIKI